MLLAYATAALWLPSQVFALDQYETLEAGEAVYQGVVVRSQNASSLIISHSKGISQIPFGDLSPELQKKYGYDEAADKSRKSELEMLRRRQIITSHQRLEQKRAEEAKSLASRRMSASSGSFGRFGTPPALKEEVDLRPEFRELGISPSNQGRRPSCAVHAVVGAVEYVEGKQKGAAENLSEFYLYWATQKTLGRYDQSRMWNQEDAVDNDAGFQLREVMQAMRAYGVPSASEAPGLGNDVAVGLAGPPSQEVIERARKRSGIRPFAIPGRDKDVLLGNVVHVLNAGKPVVIGMAWPYFRSIRRTAVLENQKIRENYGHAVILVGYRSPTKKMEDATFIFRNSWGPRWGANGYGYIRYKYIKEHLFDAYVVEMGK